VASEGIRVNVVRPGMIDTDIHATFGQPDRVDRLGAQRPMGRAGRPEEVAAAAVWLLGDAASYCTGSVLDVAGGLALANRPGLLLAAGRAEPTNRPTPCYSRMSGGVAASLLPT
jgi:enoyl-[acyl-carrier-protein] reductase (NADH)